MPTSSTCLLIFWLDNQRQPQLSAFVQIIKSGRIGFQTLIWKTKACRHDANHCESRTTDPSVGIDGDLFPNNIWGTTKTALPQTMAQNDDPVLPRPFFLRQEGTGRGKP